MRLTLCLALAVALPAQAADRVAIASFELVGVNSAELRRALHSSLAGGLAVAGLDVVPEPEVARGRERERGLAGCTTMTCLHRLAELIGVKTVVKARVEAVGSNYVFVLDRIDPVLERVIGHVDDNCQVCTGAEANEALTNAARKLGGAPADENDSKARALDAQAAADYAAGRFEQAAREFEEAYALSKRTPLLWNIAQSYRRQFEIDRDFAKLRRARVVVRNFLGLSPPPGQQRDAEALAREIDAELSHAPGAEAIGIAPIASAPIASLPAEPPQKPPLYKRWQLWLGVGIGLAAIAIGVGVGVGVSHSGGTDYWQTSASRCAMPNCSLVDLRP
jgi:hypothetical protein